MPHNSREDRSANGRKPRLEITEDNSGANPRHEVSHTSPIVDEQHNGVRVPFYDDPNHVAYGWQQMATPSAFANLHSLMRSIEHYSLMSLGSRPQSWPVEQQREATKIEQGGFNPHPKRGKGPRRPPPLTEAENRNLHYPQGASKATFKPFVDSKSTDAETEGVEATVVQEYPRRRALNSKDVNQELRNAPNQEETSPLMKPTGGLRQRNQHSQSKRLLADTMESSQYEHRKGGRMAALPKEPPPIKIQKTHSRSGTIEQVRMLRAEQKNDQVAPPSSDREQKETDVTVAELGAEENVMESLTSAIKDWNLTPTAGHPRHELEHGSAVPKPLDLAAIMAAKEMEEARSQLENSPGEAVVVLPGAKIESVKSSATSTSSDFDKLSVPESDEHNGSRHMVADVVQECLSLLDSYPNVAREASTRARFAAESDPLRFGVRMGEIKLQQLLLLSFNERRDITQDGPTVDWYLGDTRVYKRTTRTLLFAFCPDIGRHVVPLDGRFVIRLPQGFSNVLAVKLAVLYMEQYLLNTKVRNVPWRVKDDIATYIYLAELFAFIGLPDDSDNVEKAIYRRFRESPLQFEQIRAIWGRDNHIQPSKYVEAMTDNIVTFMCVPKMHLFTIEHDIEPEAFEEVMKKTMKRMKDAYPDKEGSS